jgi:hypothetical protein
MLNKLQVLKPFKSSLETLQFESWTLRLEAWEREGRVGRQAAGNVVGGKRRAWRRTYIKIIRCGLVDQMMD